MRENSGARRVESRGWGSWRGEQQAPAAARGLGSAVTSSSGIWTGPSLVEFRAYFGQALKSDIWW